MKRISIKIGKQHLTTAEFRSICTQAGLNEQAEFLPVLCYQYESITGLKAKVVIK